MLVVGIIALVRLYQWDYREVKLQYVGTVKVEPPLIEILWDNSVSAIKTGKGIWSLSARNRLQKNVEEWFAFQTNKKIKIHWEEVSLKDGEIYYACIGCQIVSMRYFYHSKYTNVINDKSKFAVHSISLIPIIEQSVITIYRGDVAVSDIGLGFPFD